MGNTKMSEETVCGLCRKELENEELEEHLKECDE